jgi:hypothetical protein
MKAGHRRERHRPSIFRHWLLAVRDAGTFAAELKAAAEGFYDEVHIRTAFDAEATPTSLDRIFESISADIGPRDTFVLFAAAHGYSLNGRFYLIPQDYNGGTDPSGTGRAGDRSRAAAGLDCQSRPSTQGPHSA